MLEILEGRVSMMKRRQHLNPQGGGLPRGPRARHVGIVNARNLGDPTGVYKDV